MSQLLDFLLNHWLLTLALLMVVGMLFMNSARNRLLGFQELGATEAVQLMNHDDPLVLDVRSAEEFAQGHILGAINIPHDQLESRLAELEPHRGRKILLYCRTGQRAAVAASLLRKSGHASLCKLNGGLLAWQSAGLPLSRAGEASGSRD